MNKFRGWKSVFSFNYKQNAGSKSYIVVTALVAVLIIAAAVIISVIAAKPEEGGDAENVSFCTVETAYVLDLTGMGEMQFEEWIPELSEEYYQYLTLVQVRDMTVEELQTMAAQDEYGLAVGVVIEKVDNNIHVTAVVPSTSEEISLMDGQEIADLVAVAVEEARFLQSGLTALQFSQVNKQIVIGVQDVGQETNVVVYLVQYLAPAVFGIVLYFLLLLYGQKINQGVSVEKTSKLVETLLTSLHPYALLTGKVFAIVVTAMQQFFIWVAALFIGIIGGGKIAELNI